MAKKGKGGSFGFVGALVVIVVVVIAAYILLNRMVFA